MKIKHVMVHEGRNQREYIDSLNSYLAHGARIVKIMNSGYVNGVLTVLYVLDIEDWENER
jgi:hypothetical protein